MSSMAFNFANKVALITGSSSGIGAAAAVLLSSYGAKVVVTGRNEQLLAQVEKECIDKSPQKLNPLVVKADLINEDDVKMLAEKTLKQFGGVDILVNNAGFGTTYAFEDEKYLEGYDKVMNLNVRSVLQLTHILLPTIKQRKGTIINVSSVAGIRSAGSFFAYCMSKAALDSFTQSLAQMVGPEVRVNSLNPGPIATNFRENLLGGSLARGPAVYDALPLKRVGTSEEMANIIAFLASDASSYMTGSIVVADGGSLVKKPW